MKTATYRPERLAGARRSAAHALVALCALSAGARAQDPAGVGANGPGARVRVVTDPKTPAIVGMLIARHGDSLLIRRSEDTAVVLQGDVMSYEISGGKHHQVRRSIGIGGLTGAAVGAAIGAASYSPCHPSGFMSCFMAPRSREESTAWGAVLGVSTGGVIGLLVGVLAEFDTWVPMPLPKATSAFHVMPSREGIAFTLTIPLR